MEGCSFHSKHVGAFLVEGGGCGFKLGDVELVSAPERDRCHKVPSMTPHSAVEVLEAFCLNWRS